MPWIHLARPLAAAAVSLCLATPVPASPPPSSPPPSGPATVQPARRDLNHLLEPIRAKHDLPALTGAIVKGDQVIALGAVGTRKRGDPEPVTTSDLWHIGSCTKAMTATLCALLVEEGLLRWGSTLAEVFPDLADGMHESFRGVTLEQLLTNRGGVPTSLDAAGLWGRLWTHRGEPRDARRLLLTTVTGRPPEYEPGSRFLYANGGFAIAGHMAETVTGLAFEELIQQRLFAPLGITTAGFGAPGTAGDEGVDQPWGHGAGGKPVPPGPRADNPPAISPAGRVHISMEDWARYIALHLRGDPANPACAPLLLKPETFARLHTPGGGPTAAGPGSDYACGWACPSRPWGGGTVLTHNGSNTMWFAVTWIAPRKDFAVLVACNQGGDTAARACDEVAAALIRELQAMPQ